MTDVEDDGPPDPRVEAALARTRADLAGHAAQVEQRVRDEPRLPPAVLAGLDRALAAERGRPVDDRSRRVTPRSRWALGAAALAALVALVVLVAVGLGAGPTAVPDGPTAPAPVASPPPEPDDADGVPRLRGEDVVVAWRAGLGRAEYGALADPARRSGCLAAHGAGPPSVPVGAHPVLLDGRPAVLMVLTTGVAARFRVLVVAPECGPGAPLTLADHLVGR